MQTIKFWVGPHHGEYQIPESKWASKEGETLIKITHIDWDDLYDESAELRDDKAEADAMVKLKEKLQGYWGKEIEIANWGLYTLIEISPGDTYLPHWATQEWFADYQASVIKTFLFHGADDDVYDYIPSFFYTFIHTMEALHHFGVWKGDLEKEKEKLYLMVYIIDPDYPEFFPDELFEKFKQAITWIQPEEQ